MLSPPSIPELIARLNALELRVEKQDIENAGLAALLSERDAYIVELKAEIIDLKAKLNKNSSNSSVPPSKDPPNFDRNKTRRRNKRKRKPGGQRGHKGSTRKMVDNPDVTVQHSPPPICQGCGSSTEGLTFEVFSRHQVSDIPKPPPPIVTEHQVLGCTCGKCGQKLRGSLPEGVSSAPFSFGERISGYAAYLSVRHYLPFARLKELFLTLFGISISTGTLVNMLTRKTEELKPVATQIKTAISKSAVVGADEAYVREAGKKILIWIWCTLRYVYLARGPNRAYEVVEREWPNGFPNSILTSDRLPTQLKTPSAANQICTHHLLRECNGLSERSDATVWIEFMKEVIKDIIIFGALGRRCYKPRYESIEIDLDELLHDKWQENLRLPAGELTLYKGLRRQREHLTTCLYHRDVPPDNDAAERGIRGAKVKMNVSNQFRSKTGTEQYCIIRSVIATALLQGIGALDVLTTKKSLNFGQ